MFLHCIAAVCSRQPRYVSAQRAIELLRVGQQTGSNFHMLGHMLGLTDDSSLRGVFCGV